MAGSKFLFERISLEEIRDLVSQDGNSDDILQRESRSGPPEPGPRKSSRPVRKQPAAKKRPARTH